METILWLILIVVASVYLFGPFAVRFLHKQAAEPVIEPIDDSQLPHDVLPFFNNAARELEIEGLHRGALLVLTDYIPNMTAYAALFQNDAALELVGAFAIEHQAKGMPKIAQNYHEIMLRFQNGEEVCINNSGQLLPLPLLPNKRLLAFPEIKSVRTLYEVVQRLLTNDTELASKSRVPLSGDPASHLRESILYDQRARVEQGILYLDSGSQAYRPTLKGAILMTYSLLPPVSLFRAAQRKRQNSRLLRSIGISSSVLKAMSRE
jgi:hypothetical protein